MTCCSNGGKVGASLLESIGAGARIDNLIIGIGVNLAGAPAAAEVEPGALPPVSLHAETGVNDLARGFPRPACPCP